MFVWRSAIIVRFYRLPGAEGGYVLSQEQVFAKLDELLELGGDLAAFNGGFQSASAAGVLLRVVCRRCGARYGETLEFYALTIAEFMYLADHAKLSYAETAERFQGCGGCGGLPGAGRRF